MRIQGFTLVAFAALLGLTGCSSTQALDPEVRLTLHSVQLNPAAEGEVVVDGDLPGPYDIGPSNGFYGTPYTVPIGVLYDLWHWGEHDAKKARAFKKILADREVDILGAVQAVAEETLQRRGYFQELTIIPPTIDAESSLVPSSSQEDSSGSQPRVSPATAHAESLPLVETPVFSDNDWAQAFDNLDQWQSDFPQQQIALPMTSQPTFTRPVGESLQNSHCDAELTLQVDYGVNNIGVVDEAWLPWVKVTGTLTAPDGEILWRHSELSDPDSGDLAQLPFPNPFRDARYVRKNYITGARLATRRVLLELFVE